MTARSLALFIAAEIAEIGGAYLVWVGLREHKGALFVVLGALSLAIYRPLGRACVRGAVRLRLLRRDATHDTSRRVGVVG